MFAMSWLGPDCDINVSVADDEVATDHLLRATAYVASPHSASVHHGLE
jgi:hypothetical protein